MQMENVNAHLRVTHQTDIWSLGILIVKLLSGIFNY